MVPIETFIFKNERHRDIWNDNHISMLVSGLSKESEHKNWIILRFSYDIRVQNSPKSQCQLKMVVEGSLGVKKMLYYGSISIMMVVP